MMGHPLFKRWNRETGSEYEMEQIEGVGWVVKAHHPPSSRNEAGARSEWHFNSEEQAKAWVNSHATSNHNPNR